MKIILITLLVYSAPSFALEWNQKAFSDSLNSYKSKAKEWINDPKGAVNDFNAKYGDSYELVKTQVQEQIKGFKKPDFAQDWQNLEVYYDYLQGKYQTYAHVGTGRQMMDLLSRDISQTFDFAYNNLDRVPLIGPYKAQVMNKVRNIQTQVIPYRAVIQSAANHAL